jgi:DNA-binding Xre family transcriptional regulator
MDITYKKLWKLLIDRELKKKDLQQLAGISPSSVSKLSTNKPVSMDVLVRVCQALGVDFGDVVELVPKKAKAASGEIVS